MTAAIRWLKCINMSETDTISIKRVMTLVTELVSEMLHYLDHLTWLSGQEYLIEAF